MSLVNIFFALSTPGITEYKAYRAGPENYSGQMTASDQKRPFTKNIHGDQSGIAACYLNLGPSDYHWAFFLASG